MYVNVVFCNYMYIKQQNQRLTSLDLRAWIHSISFTIVRFTVNSEMLTSENLFFAHIHEFIHSQIQNSHYQRLSVALGFQHSPQDLTNVNE